MNGLLRRHRNSAIIMTIATVVCIWSGKKENMKVHKCSAFIMAVSGLICMISGYRMVHPPKPYVRKSEREKTAVEEPAEEE